MPLTSGTKLGPYETQSQLGAGGMGEVYKARDTSLGRILSNAYGGVTMKHLLNEQIPGAKALRPLIIGFVGIAIGLMGLNFPDFAYAAKKCKGNSREDIMVKVGPICVDKYEASVWSSIDGTGTQYGVGFDDYDAAGFPDTGNWTTPLYAVSKSGVTPSRFITWFQAQQACALSGKRLLTNAEWQMAVAGSPTDYEPASDDGMNDCNTSTAGDVVNTGSRSNCVSSWLLHDMVGNLWEWVADWIQGNTNPWTPSGFFGDAGGVYGNDRMEGTNPATVQGNGQAFPSVLLRGGAWADFEDAGVFTLSAINGPAMSANYIGFRCAQAEDK